MLLDNLDNMMISEENCSGLFSFSRAVYDKCERGQWKRKPSSSCK